MTELIKTIDEEDNAGILSEDSGSDEEFQPTRKRLKSAKSGGIDPGFDFTQYNQDTWTERILKVNKLKKLTKRTTVDDKINRRKGQVSKTNGINELNETIEIKSESESEDEQFETKEDGFESDDSISKAGGKKNKNKKGQVDLDDINLSDDELQQDALRVKVKDKKKKKKGKNRVEEDEDEDEDESNVAVLESDPDYVFETDLSFHQMNLSRPLLKAITSLAFVHPTPIQAAAIPLALAGRDICGCAATGTGKTAAYMLPVLERLLYKPRAQAVTRVLCLVPTRELGVQVYTVTKQLASFSNEIQVGLSVGGLDVQAQEQVLRQNPDIVIATPGRLIDHLGNTPSFTLDSIEILILDEADRMLDDWFADQLKEIIRQCSPRRQTLLFSATMTDRVKDLASVSLQNPAKIFVDSNKQVAFNLRQQFVRIRNESDREAMLASLIVRTFHSKTMVFVPTKKIAHRLHILLGLMGIRMGELHGDLTQIQRLEGLKKFQTGEVDVLIVTDVAARGLDIPGVQSVVNYTMPPTLEQYIHRCGRTARAGRSGLAVSLVGESDRRLMKQVAKAATQPVKARLIPPEMITKYRDKVKNLESKIESIMAEEEAEKTIAKAEIEANKAIKSLESKAAKKKKKKAIEEQRDEGQRKWFQSHKDRSEETKRLKGKRLTAKEREAAAEANENLKLKKIAEFQARAAKRSRRQKRNTDGNVGGTDGSSRGKGPVKKSKKKQSHFENELTNVKSARQYRHQSKFKSSFGGVKPKSSGGSGQKGKQFPGSKAKGQGGKGSPLPKKSARKFNQKMKRK